MSEIPLHYIFLILVAVTYVVLSDLKEGAKKIISKNSGNDTIILKLHKFYLFLGFGLIICSSYLSIQLINAIFNEKGEYWLELTLINAFTILLILILGIFYTLSYFNHRVVIKHESIEISNWRRRKISIQKGEISEFKDDFNRRKFRIYVHGKCIRVHQHIVGLATLKNWLKKPFLEE
jgi:hypothetical protein